MGKFQKNSTDVDVTESEGEDREPKFIRFAIKKKKKNRPSDRKRAFRGKCGRISNQQSKQTPHQDDSFVMQEKQFLAAVA